MNTQATEETQARKAKRDEAVRKDLGLYQDGQPVTRMDKTGIVQMHVPGDVDENGIAVWKVAPFPSIEQKAASTMTTETPATQFATGPERREAPEGSRAKGKDGTILVKRNGRWEKE